MLQTSIVLGGNVSERLNPKVGFLGNRGRRSTQLEAAKTPVQVAVEYGNGKIATKLIEEGCGSSNSGHISR